MGKESDSLLDEELHESPQHGLSKSRGQIDEIRLERPSIVIEDTDDVGATVARALDQWALSSPDIIVTFVSGTRSFTSWKNEDHRAALQKGIIKLLNASETWIIDSGLDYGISRLIGNAVRNELQFRQSKREYEVYVRGYLRKHRHSIVLMGVVPTSLLKGAEEKEPEHDNDAHTEEHPDKFDVNPFHTHFLFVKSSNKDMTGIRRSQIMIELVNQVSARKSPTFVHGIHVNDTEKDVGCQKNRICHEQVPLIAVLIQGGQTALDMVHQYLKYGIPVLVIKGSGFLADILAFAFEENKERGSTRSLLDIIKRDVSKRVARFFPDTKLDGGRAKMRDKIMECLALATHKERELLSVVESSEDLVDLDKYFLPAIFASRSRAANILQEQVRSDFLLTMKLNKTAIADSKILGRDEQQIFQVDNDLFEKAILWKDREKFVERFLEKDFALHHFISHTRLLHLFRHAEDNDFFVTVVWHQIPRHYSDHTIEETFVTTDLNRIVEKLSGFRNFLSMHELSSNYLGIYVKDEYDAERKAMNALMVWAVLMNRFQLAKTLWKFCEDPIPMALFVSALYRGLAEHCGDTSMVDMLHANGREFSIMAIDVLDMSYKESNARTFDLLNQKFPDFNNRTPIKAAYLSHNKYFLAHEACQIWLNRLWGGGIEIAYSMESRIPDEVKLVLSALLLFPLYFWIQFPAKNFAKFSPTDQSSVIDVSAPDDNHRLGYENAGRRDKNDRFHVSHARDKEGSESTIRKLKELSEVEAKHQTFYFRRSMWRIVSEPTSSNSTLYMDSRLPFWKKVRYLWSAPRTKFWVFQVFYWMYLAIFSVVVILPTCNEYRLDVVILIWTMFNVIEIALRTAYQMRHDFPVSLVRRVQEIVLITGFVLCVTVFKTYFLFIRPLHTRALMAFGLLYMYYRMITVFFPMNPVLGPMLYRIKRMILVDFVSFVRLALPFVLANMFVLQSVMYPDLPFGVETWRKGFYRAFFTLFVAFIGEIDYTPKCEAVRLHNGTDDICWIGDYANYTCPTLGFTTYILSIQFWIIMRLILVVLLNALFAATMIKVKEDAEYIFRYQRYRTVLDFASRSALPPPLSVLSYMFNWISICCVKNRKKNSANSRAIKLLEKNSQTKRSYESYSYWMGLTKEYYRKKDNQEREKKIPQEQLSKMKSLADEQKVIRGTLTRLTDKLKQLEKSSVVYFEEIKHNMDRKGHAKEGTLNLLSRTSPYPGTGIKRTLIPDHKVPWDIDLNDYDPPKYYRDIDDYHVTHRKFIDLKPGAGHLNDSAFWCWNDIKETDGVLIDRRTVLLPSKDQEGPVQYAIDNQGLPRNVVGRTGLADRGNLYRYGPNHSVQVVLTRYTDDILRFLVAKNSVYSNLPSLFPMVAILDGRNPFLAAYQLVFSLFNSKDSSVMDLTVLPENEEDMRKLMELVVFADADEEAVKFLSVQQIYSGYLDHQDNTDNAWMETIVWHVDITTSDGVAQLQDENFSWKERGYIRRTKPFEDHILEHVTIAKVVDD